jgi:type IV secretion system protein VirB8
MLNESQVPEPVEGLDEYLKQNDLWVNDIKSAKSRSAKVVRYAAISSFTLNLLLGGAILGLTPLKTVEPYMIVEDSHTGFWRVERPLNKDFLQQSEVRDRFIIGMYMMYREGYSRAFYEDSYENLGLMSSVNEQKKLGEIFSKENPNSPWNIYGADSYVKVFVKNISFLNKNTAQVRFSKLLYKNNDATPTVTNWVAIFNFDYKAGAKMSAKALMVNPTAFQVSEYRKDEELAGGK